MASSQQEALHMGCWDIFLKLNREITNDRKDILGGGSSLSAYSLTLWVHLMSFNFLFSESYLEKVLDSYRPLIIVLGFLYPLLNIYPTIWHFNGKDHAYFWNWTLV